jgi:hypothetical protein
MWKDKVVANFKIGIPTWHLPAGIKERCEISQEGRCPKRSTSCMQPDLQLEQTYPHIALLVVVTLNNDHST